MLFGLFFRQVLAFIMFSPEMMKTAQSMMANMSPEVPWVGGLRNQRGEDFGTKTFAWVRIKHREKLDKYELMNGCFVFSR